MWKTMKICTKPIIIFDIKKPNSCNQSYSAWKKKLQCVYVRIVIAVIVMCLSKM